ncbi:MAG: hypothetical protein ACOX2A_03345 [Tepidanaerobacteraceae bacterium]
MQTVKMENAMIGNYKDRYPKIHESCFIAPTADIIGDVANRRKIQHLASGCPAGGCKQD